MEKVVKIREMKMIIVEITVILCQRFTWSKAKDLPTRKARGLQSQKLALDTTPSRHFKSQEFQLCTLQRLRERSMNSTYAKEHV